MTLHFDNQEDVVESSVSCFEKGYILINKKLAP